MQWTRHEAPSGVTYVAKHEAQWPVLRAFHSAHETNIILLHPVVITTQDNTQFRYKNMSPPKWDASSFTPRDTKGYVKFLPDSKGYKLKTRKALLA